MKPLLTVLSFGAGQDSTCILYKYVFDENFRKRWLKGNLIVVMSDTGNEHPHTYSHIEFIRKFCRKHNIPFHFITPDLGYHPNTWPSLQGQYLKNRSLMSVAFPKSCTDNLKIKPVYAFLDHYIAVNYFGYKLESRPKGKYFLKLFAKVYGKINVILGIAHGEEKRIREKAPSSPSGTPDFFDSPSVSTGHKWMNLSINKQYPLVEEKIDRKACQEYITSLGLPLPYPSNCIMCPYLSKIEILWLYRNLPDEFNRWVWHEKRKLEKNNGKMKRNLGVKGEKTLDIILDEAIHEFGHLTDRELDLHKMSHGHCVMSAF